MMTLDELRERLAGVDNLSEVARRAGITRMTALRIRGGKNQPNLRTFLALEAALSGEPPKKEPEHATTSQSDIDTITRPTARMREGSDNKRER